ncbi:MAG: acyltransferase 3 [Candidatus Solibacter sp.]|nr:acyltransferase 3 [Candidatus Solibacter sp.]
MILRERLNSLSGVRDTSITGVMTNSDQDPNLDVLRSVAVLAVLVTHALQVIAGCKPGEHLAYGVETYSLGRIGVLLFFVHTSIVLMRSLERTRTNLSGLALVRHFYVRRAFRIYPLSICLILLSITFSIPANALNVPYEWQGARWALANLLLIQNIAGVGQVADPLWSLPYEVQMYLVLPIVFLLVRTPRGTVRLGLIFAGGSALSLLHPLFRFVPCFLAGVVAYKLLATVRPRFPAWLWCPVVTGAVVMYVLAPHADSSWLKDVTICLVVGALIPLFHRGSGTIAAAASQVAKYSYGIYLCHTPVLWLLYRKLEISDWQRPIWFIIATGGISVACYHAIEHPLIKVGARLARRVSVRFSAEPVAAALL